MNMYTKQSKKLLIMNILDILRKYTDEDHRLSQKEIVDILRREYEMKADRKAVRRNIPDADFLFWSYSFVWNKIDIRREMMERLPKDVKLHVTFELGGGNPRPGGSGGAASYPCRTPDM